MYKDLLAVLRVAAGIMLLLLGIIGLFLPILQGWLLIFIAIPLISPAHGKKMVEKLKEFRAKIIQKWRMRKVRKSL